VLITEDPQDGGAVTSAMAARPRLATVTLTTVIVALTAFVVLSTVLAGTFSAVHLWSATGLIVIIVVTAMVGLVVVRHQPRNPIGWLLAAAALFTPLRLRVQHAVDRRFNRARYDADQTIAAFATYLKDAVDLDSVRTDLTAVVHRALEPAHVSLWLTPRD